MHRGDLQRVLHEAVGAEPVQLGARCIAVSSEAGSAVARFEGGSEIEADAIIGADGIHSVVRASLFGPEQPRFTGHMCWRGLAETQWLPAEIARNEYALWLGPHAHVVHYGVRRGELLNWVAITEVDSWREESWSCEGDLRELQETYPNWNPHLLRLFSVTERSYKWALFDREPLDKWSRGRITLLGDAAHAMLPYLAQGAAQSLEDACVLAAQIEATPNDLAGALLRYEQLRIPRTRRIQLGARARGALSHLPSVWARFRRDVAFTLRRWFKPNAPLHQAEWIYRYDPGES
jgi:salicylate hydroxylase